MNRMNRGVWAVLVLKTVASAGVANAAGTECNPNGRQPVFPTTQSLRGIDS